MAKRIALVAAKGSGCELLRAQISNPLIYLVREFNSVAQVEAELKGYPFDVLVTRFPRYFLEHAGATAQLRTLFPQHPIVTVAVQIDPVARFEIRNLTRHKLLEESTEVGDLPFVIEALLDDSSDRQRLHPRVKRVGHAEVSDADQCWRVEAKFLDFAQMGARLTVKSSEPIKAKTRVRVAYRSSSDPTRIHRIESVVVWSEWSWGAHQEIGVRFIAAI